MQHNQVAKEMEPLKVKRLKTNNPKISSQAICSNDKNNGLTSWPMTEPYRSFSGTIPQYLTISDKKAAGKHESTFGLIRTFVLMRPNVRKRS